MSLRFHEVPQSSISLAIRQMLRENCTVILKKGRQKRAFPGHPDLSRSTMPAERHSSFWPDKPSFRGRRAVTMKCDSNNHLYWYVRLDLACSLFTENRFYYDDVTLSPPCPLFFPWT
jgi:hypothetical protein